jgi:glycosidase
MKITWLLLEEQERQFPSEALAVHFLNNHDTNRILGGLDGDMERARLAPALLATLPGPVMLYYGEEVGMPGKEGGPPHWDSYRREPMQWSAENTAEWQTTRFAVDDPWNQPHDRISVEEQGADSSSLLTFYRHALDLQKTHPALQGREIRQRTMGVSIPGPWGFIRGEGDEALIALFGFAIEPRSATLTGLPYTDGVLIDLLGDDSSRGILDGGQAIIQLEAGQAMLLGVASQD